MFATLALAGLLNAVMIHQKENVDIIFFHVESTMGDATVVFCDDMFTTQTVLHMQITKTEKYIHNFGMPPAFGSKANTTIS